MVVVEINNNRLEVSFYSTDEYLNLSDNNESAIRITRENAPDVIKILQQFFDGTPPQNYLDEGLQ